MTTGLAPSRAPSGPASWPPSKPRRERRRERPHRCAVRRGRSGVTGGDPQGRGGLPAVVHLAPVAGAPQPLEELAEGEVEGGRGVLRAGLRADHGALAADRDLDLLAVLGLAGVALVGELDVGPVGLGCELSDLEQLLLREAAEPLGNLGVTPADDDLHCWTSPFLAGRVVRSTLVQDRPARLPAFARRRGVHATAATPATRAPAARSTAHASAALAPVVTTSSTTTTSRPAGAAPGRTRSCRRRCAAGPRHRGPPGRPRPAAGAADGRPRPGRRDGPAPGVRHGRARRPRRRRGPAARRPTTARGRAAPGGGRRPHGWRPGTRAGARAARPRRRRAPGPGGG